jgi:hypothetical protein
MVRKTEKIVCSHCYEHANQQRPRAENKLAARNLFHELFFGPMKELSTLGLCQGCDGVNNKPFNHDQGQAYCELSRTTTGNGSQPASRG